MNKKTITILIIILVIAIIAGGFWYTKNQKNTTKPVDVIKDVQDNVEQKENEMILKNDQDVEEVKTKSKFGIDDSGLKYNKDGSVDISDWKKSISGTLTFLCPPNWNSIFHGVTNMSEKNVNIKNGLVTINVGGDGIMKLEGESWEDAINQELAYIKKKNKKCEQLIKNDQLMLFKCVSIDEVNVNTSYIKIIQVKQEDEIMYNKEALEVLCDTVETCSKNEQIIKTIIENIFVNTEQFIPFSVI